MTAQLKETLTTALQAEGVLVDKRWGLDRLKQEARANGIEVPEDELEIPHPGGTPQPEVKKEPEPEVEILVKEKPVTCIALVNELHIDRKDIPGLEDNGMSQKFMMKDRFELKSETLARSLEAQGCLVVVK